MQLSSFFIQNPRFSGVIAVLMVLLGLIALVVLPISQYPQITPPQIVVSANYPGANASVIVDTVAVPIENALNGVEGMLYMSSTANDNGSYQLTITFNIGVDPDMAQVKVENRLQQVTSLLPSIVNQEGLSVKTQSANILGFLVFDSPKGTYDNLYLSNFAYSNIQNPLERVSGVSDVNIYGPQNSMRVWLDPQKLTALGLDSDKVVDAIQSQNIQAAIGSIGSAPATAGSNLVLTLTTTGQLNTVELFENIILSVSKDGGIVRLKDVARVEIGADSYELEASYNNQPAVIIALSQTPGSNSLATMKNLKKEIARLQKSFPQDMRLELVYDATSFVSASIQNVLTTLATTFLLVVLVVFLFLQNGKATFIPAITIPVSLITTFAVLYVLGFDINLLTLFALILAIGLVVDDAIIVVERVQYLMRFKKLDSLSAAVQAMKDIGSSIVATTLVLLSIFIPVGLMAGMTGKIYQQFAVTIATAVVLSAINALTLSPALCAIFFSHPAHQLNKLTKKESPLPDERKFWGGYLLQKVFDPFNRLLESCQNIYLKIVRFLITHLWMMFFLFCIAVSFIVFLFVKTPTSFLPEEDQGVFFANIQLPETASINQTEIELNKLSEKILKMKGVRYFIGISGASLLGSGGENIGMAVIGLDPWSDRTAPALSLESLMDQARRDNKSSSFVSIDFFALPAIPGVGNSDGLSFQLNAINSNTTTQELSNALDTLLTQLNKNPSFSFAFSTFSANTPHAYLEIDRTKAKMLGVSISSLFTVLQNNLGSRYVNNITSGGQINKVIVQADYDYRKSFENIENLHVPTDTGGFVQLKELLSFKIVMAPKIIDRFNQYQTASVTAAAGSGVSTGTAIDVVRNMASSLGRQFQIAWTGLSLQEVETRGLAFILIAFAFVFGYLFLVALYESWLIAVSVIISNVFAILGALIGLSLMGLPLSIYAQLGIVLLIGLASKNAILIVQFILTYHRAGMPLLEAAVKGASERFRAVLMTALTFILGVMPMVFATGAGAGSQISMGTAVFFGMILAVTVGILFIPALFVLLAIGADKYALRHPQTILENGKRQIKKDNSGEKQRRKK